MCWAIVAGEAIMVAVLMYLRWQVKEDLGYWRKCSQELDDQLRRVSESRLMEIIEAKAKQFEGGMTVEGNDHGQA